MIRISSKASITVLRPREQVEQLWRDPKYRLEYTDQADVAVRFVEAPGDRGTEIHVDLEHSAPGGKLGEAVQKLLGREPLITLKDDLRRFKQHAETGVIARSEGAPEGEMLQRKLKQRPAQPLEQDELHKAGV